METSTGEVDFSTLPTVEEVLPGVPVTMSGLNGQAIRAAGTQFPSRKEVIAAIPKECFKKVRGARKGGRGRGAARRLKGARTYVQFGGASCAQETRYLTQQHGFVTRTRSSRLRTRRRAWR